MTKAKKTSAGWSTEDVATLRKRWAEGISASQIAKRYFPGRTRNSVIGKLTRLGLMGQRAVSEEHEIHRQRRRIEKLARQLAGEGPRPPKPGNTDFEPKVAAGKTAIAISQRESSQCPYPVAGEGAREGRDLLVCGASIAPGKYYCLNCNKLAYQPGTAFRRAVRPEPTFRKRAA